MVKNIILVLVYTLLTVACMGQTQPRFEQIKNKPIFYVGDYGARPGDSIPDDTGINAAITACISAGGGKVLFASGQYDCTGTISIVGHGRLDVTLEGQGQATTLQYSGASTFIHVASDIASPSAYGDRVIGASIKGFRVLGASNTGTGISFERFGFIALEDLYVAGFNYGLSADFGSEMYAEACDFAGNTYGVFLKRDIIVNANSDLANTVFVACQFDNNTNAEILLDGVREVYFKGCAIIGINNPGCLMLGTANSNEIITFSGCDFESVTAPSILASATVATLNVDACIFALAGKDKIKTTGGVGALNVTNSLFAVNEAPIFNFETPPGTVNIKGCSPGYVAILSQLGEVGDLRYESLLSEYEDISPNPNFTYGICGYNLDSPFIGIVTSPVLPWSPYALTFPDTASGVVNANISLQSNYGVADDGLEVFVDVIHSGAANSNQVAQFLLEDASGAISLHDANATWQVSSGSGAERELLYFRISGNKRLSDVRLTNTNAAGAFSVYSCRIFTHAASRPELTSAVTPTSGVFYKGQKVWNNYIGTASDTGWIYSGSGTWRSLGSAL